MTQDLRDLPTFTIKWSYAEGRYVAKCDTRPTLRASATDPEDALADLVWVLQQQGCRT